MGYYGGAYGAIRSSLEALSYAALFESYPEEVNQAFIHDFAQQPDDYVIKARNDQLKRAKDALLDLENDRLTIKDGLKEFLQKANPFIHTSLRGLAEEFGIDVSYLLPDDFQQEFEKTGGDFSKALNRYKLLNKFGSNMLASKNLENHPEDELIQIELVGRCDKLMIEDLALFAFYIAHRILDTTRELFEIDSSDFHENYNAWHNAVKELGDLR